MAMLVGELYKVKLGRLSVMVVMPDSSGERLVAVARTAMDQEADDDEARGCLSGARTCATGTLSEIKCLGIVYIDAEVLK